MESFGRKMLGDTSFLIAAQEKMREIADAAGDYLVMLQGQGVTASEHKKVNVALRGSSASILTAPRTADFLSNRK